MGPRDRQVIRVRLEEEILDHVIRDDCDMNGVYCEYHGKTYWVNGNSRQVVPVKRNRRMRYEALQSKPYYE